MSKHGKGHMPKGPLDPVAAQIAGFFATDPGWQALKTNPIAQTRAAIKAATPVTGEPAMQRVEDFQVPVAGGAIALRYYQPGPEPRAIVVWAHGGGFALGSLDEIDNFARLLATQTDCAVASVEYRLAPEHRFPTAVEDMLAAIRWVAERRAELAGPNVPLVVGGDSAGATLATVATRKLHEAGACSIAANILAYPSTNHGAAESLRRFDAPFITVSDVTWFLEQYQPDPAKREHPDFAPRYAQNLDKLPPTLIITAEHDIITEQAQDYGQQLEEAGVEVRIIRHAGMIHGFLTMDVFFPTSAGEAVRAISDFVGKTVRAPAASRKR
jgi:acetyl esterase